MRVTMPSDIQPGGPWMVVYVAGSQPEAHIIRGRLEVNGIPSWISQEPVASAIGFVGGLFGGVRVVVRAEDYDAATDILSEDALGDEDLLDSGDINP